MKIIRHLWIILSLALVSGCASDTPSSISQIKPSVTAQQKEEQLKEDRLRKEQQKEEQLKEANLLFLQAEAELAHQGYQKATELLELAYNKGLSKAAHLLGDIYRDILPDPNYSQASEWYLKAASSKDPYAPSYEKLAELFHFDRYGMADARRAFLWASDAHNAGSKIGTFILGESYYYGKGVDENKSEARKYYDESKDSVPDSLYSLAFMQIWGQGGTADLDSGIQNLLSLIDQNREGNVPNLVDAAYRDLGTVYFYGPQGTKDRAKAFKYFSASSTFDAKTRAHLAYMYCLGDGVEFDLTLCDTNAFWFYIFREKNSKALGYETYIIRALALEFIVKENKYPGLTKTLDLILEDVHKNSTFDTPFVLSLKDHFLKQNERQTYLTMLKNSDAFESNPSALYDIGEAIFLAKEGNYESDSFRTLFNAFYRGSEKAMKFIEEKLLPKSVFSSFSDDQVYFIDKSRIKEKSNGVNFSWVLQVPRPKFDDKSYVFYVSSKSYYSFDCINETVSLKHVVVYKPNGEVDISKNFDGAETKPIIPDSIGEAHAEVTCQNTSNEVSTESISFGTAWPFDGYVVTNHHVVDGAREITLVTVGGVKIPASIALADKSNDIAILKVKNPQYLPNPFQLESAPASQGESVSTIGYPHPNVMGTEPKLTNGIINSVSGYDDDPRFLQTNVAVQSGNSGGPLLNSDGKVVGVITSKLKAIQMFAATGDLPQNVNYAIKSFYITPLINSLPKVKSRASIKFSGQSLKAISSSAAPSILLVIASP